MKNGADAGDLEASAINIFQDGKVTADGAITTDAAQLGQDGAALTGASVSIAQTLAEMKGGTITAADGDVTLAGGAKGAAGKIAASNDIISGNAGTYQDISGRLALDAGKNITAGTIAVDSLAAGADIAATDITASALTAGGNVTASASSLNLSGPGTIGGDLGLPANVESAITTLKVEGAVDISGGKLSGGDLQTGKDASFANMAAVELTGQTEIGGNLTADAVKGGSSFNTLAVAGSVNVSDGNFSAGQITAGSAEKPGDFTITNGSFSFGADSQSASVIHGELNSTGNVSSSFGDLTVDKSFNISEGYVEGESLHASSAKFTNYAVGYFDKLTLADLGSLEIEEGSMVTVGAIDAPGLDNIDLAGLIIIGDEKEPSQLGFFDLSNSVLTADRATIGACAIIGDGGASEDYILAHQLLVETPQSGESKPGFENGSVILNSVSIRLTGRGEYKSRIEKNLIITNNKSSNLGEIKVGGKTNISGGTLQAIELTTGSASFDSIQASFNALVLNNPAGGREFALTATGANSSEALVNSLALNGGSLNLAANSASQTNLYVGKFAGQANLINGNIAVSKNGMLVLGAQNADLLASPNTVATGNLAALILAQPMRLDSRYGIHATGMGAANPAANSIRFDASSLFVIDSRMTSAVYAYLGSLDSIVPSAQLSERNVATGALSADKASVPANINMGAQIYIRNPQANTVIVALGENITTLYADKTTRAGDSSAAPWTGANLDYDNKSQVTIQRLEDQYAGQFLVLPVGSDTPGEPDTPDNPDEPDNPDKPTPTPPAPDKPDTPTPPAPEKPDTPAPDNPTPDKPEEPDTPTDPGTHDDPNTPAAPGPDEPVPPAPGAPATPAPHPSVTHPNAHPGIHNVIEHGHNQGTIGTEPHHLVTHHGAGFISHTLAHDKPHEATRLLESSSRTIVLGGVPQMALLANDAANAAIQQRLGRENMVLRPEEIRAHSFALWAVPLYRATDAWQMEAEAHDYDYHGGIGGIVIGADATYDDIIRAGLAFNIGGGYAKSGGNLNETTNNMSFWGLGGYAGLVYGNFGISADVNFTSSYNKLKQDVSELKNWQDLKTDATAYVLSTALNLEYCFTGSWLDVIPHAGFKYNFIHVDDYDITHRGSTIIKGSEFNQNIWTFPLGIKLTKEFSFDNGWLLKPELDLRVTPAAGDIDARTSTRYTATDLDIDLKTKTMDYMSWGGSAGLEAKIGDFAMGVI